MKSKNKDEHYFLFCTDKDGIQDLGVCLESILFNNKYPIEVFVLHSSKINQTPLKQIAERYNQKLTFIKIDSSPIKKLPLNGWPEAAYYRMLAPKYLPDYCHKILYLDIDTVVDKNILEIFDLNLNKFSIGACPSPEPNLDKVEDMLGIPHGTHFGSGVLLMNLDKIRKENSFNKAIENGLKFPERVKAVDQDLLNMYFCKDYLRLSRRYNCSLFFGYSLTHPKNDTKIIHFTGKIKPRYYTCPHPLRDRYLFYLEKTPWKDNYEKFSIKSFFKKEGIIILRKVKHSWAGNIIFNTLDRIKSFI